MVVRLEVEGVFVDSGTSADFGIYSGLQRTVMPVVSLQERGLQCWGTAACIGAAGWFLTARHVVDDYVDAYGDRDDGTTGLFILWETDERTGTGQISYLGAPLPIAYVHRHGDADLVALTAKLPAVAPDRLRVAPLALRMPDVGEPLAVVGFRHMTLTGDVKPRERSSVDYERILTLGVGEVLGQQPERRSPGLRGSPGVVTDAPIYSGMSGGPVFDVNQEIVGFASSSMAPGAPDEPWNSYVALCGPALELCFMVREADGDKPHEMTLAELVAADAVLCSAYDTFDVDKSTGKAVYRSSR